MTPAGKPGETREETVAGMICTAVAEAGDEVR